MTSVSATPLSRHASDVALRDGSTVHVRPVTADDRDAIAALLSSMSPDSLYFRGCGQVDTDWLSDWAVDIDTTDRFGLVVTAGSPPAIVAHAGYVRIDERSRRDRIRGRRCFTRARDRHFAAWPAGRRRGRPRDRRVRRFRDGVQLEDARGLHRQWIPGRRAQRWRRDRDLACPPRCLLTCWPPLIAGSTRPH